jgi:hypothetical protein
MEIINEYFNYFFSLPKWIQYTVLVVLIWINKGSIFKAVVETITWIIWKLLGKTFSVPSKLKNFFIKKPFEFKTLKGHNNNNSKEILNYMNSLLDEEFLIKNLELKIDEQFQELRFNYLFLFLNDEKVYKFIKPLNKKWFESEEIIITIEKI